MATIALLREDVVAGAPHAGGQTPLLALGCLVLFIGLVVGFVLLAAGCFWLLAALVLLGLLVAGWVCLACFASGCLLPAFAGSLLAVHC